MRIRLLDILRGTAIVGTLGTNIWIFAHLGNLNAVFTFQDYEWWSSFDTFLRIFFLSLINGKLLGLLSIMFGVGMELKYQQALRKSRPWPSVYLWTAFILLIEGLLHFTLVFDYDILMSYAVTAVIVSLIVKAGEKAIKRTMYVIGGLHFTLILFISLGIFILQMTDQSFSFAELNDETAIYQNGTWLEQIHFRITNFLSLRSEVIFTIPLNVFLFLTGILLMRKGAFATDEKGKKIRRKMLKIGICAGLPLNLLFFVPGGVFDFSVRYLFAPVLTIGYIGLVAAAVENQKLLILWGWLEKVGKMSLSCYVMQNIVCSIVFYGWGFGLGGRIDSLAIIALWIAINVVQILFAVQWLRYFAHGPLESTRKVLSGFVTGEK